MILLCVPKVFCRDINSLSQFIITHKQWTYHFLQAYQSTKPGRWNCEKYLYQNRVQTKQSVAKPDNRRDRRSRIMSKIYGTEFKNREN
jgi:hypothetical protein